MVMRIKANNKCHKANQRSKNLRAIKSNTTIWEGNSEVTPIVMAQAVAMMNAIEVKAGVGVEVEVVDVGSKDLKGNREAEVEAAEDLQEEAGLIIRQIRNEIGYYYKHFLSSDICNNY